MPGAIVIDDFSPILPIPRQATNGTTTVEPNETPTPVTQETADRCECQLDDLRYDGLPAEQEPDIVITHITRDGTMMEVNPATQHHHPPRPMIGYYTHTLDSEFVG